MVIDVSYILNELDVLEARLTFLDPFVDKFVIVESNVTFSGVPKPFVVEENMARFDKWAKKISYYKVVNPMDNYWDLRLVAERSPNTGGYEIWIREFIIKEAARKPLIGLDDNDIVFISDLDEFWNPKLKFEPKGGEVLKPKQLPYLYYFNQRTDEDWLGWTGTTVCRYETVKNGIINHIRTDELQPYTVMENGGWHFNSIGGKERKQKASQHPLVNTIGDWERREVNMRRDEKDLPPEILALRDKWPHYFLNE